MKSTKKLKKKRQTETVENPLPQTCPYCGLEYDDFKTGESFATIKESMYVADADPSKWKYKRRHGVLGRWHDLKQELWRSHIDFHEQGSGPEMEVPIEEDTRPVYSFEEF